MDGSFGPELPPGFKKEIKEDIPKKKIVGPLIPPELLGETPIEENNELDDDSIGPVLPGSVKAQELLERQKKKEEDLKNWEANEWKRLRENKEDNSKREEWMISLPERRTGLTGTGARKFSKSGDVGTRDDSWTTKPSERTKYKPDRELLNEKEEEENKIKSSQLMDQIEKKRGPSLVELHQAELAKKQSSGPTERKPFDRENDVVHRQVDPQKRQKMIHDSSKNLNDLFQKTETRRNFL